MKRLRVILTILAVLATAGGTALVFADRVSNQVGVGAGLIVVGVATWLIVTQSA